jgi:hypothetical protein
MLGLALISVLLAAEFVGPSDGAASDRNQREIRYYSCLSRADLSVEFRDFAKTRVTVHDWKQHIFVLVRDETDSKGLGFSDPQNRVYLWITQSKALYGLIDKGYHCPQVKVRSVK